MTDDKSDLEARLGRVEAWVGWLIEQERARAIAGASPPTVGVTAPLTTNIASVDVTQATNASHIEPTPGPSPQTLVAALGAAIFLAGVGFFLWLSFERGWVGPEVRILSGLVVGVTMSTAAARMILRGAHAAVGVALLGAGLGTLQFALWAGASLYQFFPSSMGFIAVAIATLLGGAIAARASNSAALIVALLSAYVAPPVFSTGGHHEVELSLYLFGVVVATTLVPYLAGIGARWNAARWLIQFATWGYLGVICAEAQADDRVKLFALTWAHFFAALVWIWLPRQVEPRPGQPTLLWFLTSLATTGIAAAYWNEISTVDELFAVFAVGIAALQLALVRPLRKRMGSHQADLGLLVLATGHLALAVPIALDWHWVGPLWAVFALGLSWAAGHAERVVAWDAEETANLRRLAFGMAVLASLRVFISAVDPWQAVSSTTWWPLPTPFLHESFAVGILTATAWGLQIRPGATGGFTGIVAFTALQLIATLTIALELALLGRTLSVSVDGAAVIVTMVLALSGAVQWLVGLRRTDAVGKGLVLAGYAWLAIASFKLITSDLARADLAVRAVVFLVVGAIFLAAAVGGSRIRRSAKPELRT